MSDFRKKGDIFSARQFASLKLGGDCCDVKCVGALSRDNYLPTHGGSQSWNIPLGPSPLISRILDIIKQSESQMKVTGENVREISNLRGIQFPESLISRVSGTRIRKTPLKKRGAGCKVRRMGGFRGEKCRI